MGKKTLEFSTSDMQKIRALGVLIAVLTKEGIEFSLHQDDYSIRLTITGGF